MTFKENEDKRFAVLLHHRNSWCVQNYPKYYFWVSMHSNKTEMYLNIFRNISFALWCSKHMDFFFFERERGRQKSIPNFCFVKCIQLEKIFLHFIISERKLTLKRFTKLKPPNYLVMIVYILTTVCLKSIWTGDVLK